MQGTTISGQKFVQLEAARGIASIIVVVHHFALAFAPGMKNAISQGGFKFTPIYSLENGVGAVGFFFMLSGFVLTQRFYRQFDDGLLIQSTAKRLPRLMLPAGLSIILGFLALTYCPSYFASAARINGSDWLASFANGLRDAPMNPTVADAIRQTLWVFLYKKDYYYNTNLWTMYYEFYGSLLAFLIVFLISRMPEAPPWRIVVLHVLAALACSREYLFLYFIAGSLVAYCFKTKPALFEIPVRTNILMAALAVACYSTENVPALLIGATLTLISLLSPNRVSNSLAQSWGGFLGKLSFPLYLVHTIVILTVSSATYLAMATIGASKYVNLPVTFFVTCAVSTLLALPFMKLEAKWVPFLNRRVAMLGKKATP